jgi:hypothetical protein
MKFVLTSAGLMFLLLIAGWAGLMFDYPRIGLAICTAAVLPVAANLYRLRCKDKFTYGIFELVVAVGFFYFLSVGFYEKPAEPMTVQLITGRVLTFFAAIYFMVRALDNIGQGLDPARAARWKQFFEG